MNHKCYGICQEGKQHFACEKFNKVYNVEKSKVADSIGFWQLFSFVNFLIRILI